MLTRRTAVDSVGNSIRSTTEALLGSVLDAEQIAMNENLGVSPEEFVKHNDLEAVARALAGRGAPPLDAKQRVLNAQMEVSDEVYRRHTLGEDEKGNPLISKEQREANRRFGVSDEEFLNHNPPR